MLLAFLLLMGLQLNPISISLILILRLFNRSALSAGPEIEKHMDHFFCPCVCVACVSFLRCFALPRCPKTQGRRGQQLTRRETRSIKKHLSKSCEKSTYLGVRSRWPPGPSRERSRLLVPILSIFWLIFGSIWPPWGGNFRQKSTTVLGKTYFLALRDAPGSILEPPRLIWEPPGSILECFR